MGTEERVRSGKFISSGRKTGGQPVHTLRVNDECPYAHTSSEPIFFLACLYFTFKYSQATLFSDLAEVYLLLLWVRLGP